MFKLSAKKEDKFFILFDQVAHTALKGAKMLEELLHNLESSQERLEKIKELEHEGDKLQHEILEELNKTFLTPFDREDIYMIAKYMDDIIDYIESTASRFVMLNVNYSTEDSLKLTEMIVKCCEELIVIMEELKNMKENKKLSQSIIEVNRIEQEGDKIFRNAIRQIFSGEMEVLEIIKWKEIYQFLEDTLDACEDVANVIEGVVMKNA
ncbi:hypothetical protein BD780_002026 [Clostridium tetanomorphum]|uniref:DUF47 domain-containing protein n=1 Tax=Clostridium tetanomorphum TaxID=1553 RepID=A0A923ED30_CLOTT|nr:DUF47 domain-containing protein [Clostridium tetanomorphum]KAJ52846.1 hypothetical protein CTM_05925 [Clostridium tetanomorphum DSM 665]MBC2399166.1 DUF47 domain-containing protein [Clostridium tetanomorphum]MBP1865432.1 uncharacterized protein Yka (UPF0111/DUF47 family) [Clostridium tetanomorphum]NRS84801.1 hypothetical protein [Clostridium tetanomorphum]NRZ98018.1 hypothetical protein [Clostridium tetanomorphum]